MFTRVLDDCWQVASTGPGAGADLIVHNVRSWPGSTSRRSWTSRRFWLYRCRCMSLPGVPVARSAAAVMAARAGERLTYAGMKAPALMFGRTVDRWRSGLGLPRRRGQHDPSRRPDGQPAPVLHAVSPAVIPRPADWPPTAHITGYWFVDTAAADITAPAGPHLAGGDDQPAVFVGFGSMTGPDPAAATEEVVQALRLAGVRGVLAAGWNGLQQIPGPDTFLAGDVPHETVFPQSAVIVHHGGAGTTAAAARAGRPQVVCSFVGDQPFWGARMHQRGVAPEPISVRHLTVPRLAAAIRRAIDDPAMVTAARRLGEQVRTENGVATAAAILEQFADGHR
jgi:sterol 3beta-glucosyltransferase